MKAKGDLNNSARTSCSGWAYPFHWVPTRLSHASPVLCPPVCCRVGLHAMKHSVSCFLFSLFFISVPPMYELRALRWNQERSTFKKKEHVEANPQGMTQLSLYLGSSAL